MNRFTEEQIKKINSVLALSNINIDLTNEENLNKSLSDLQIDSLRVLGIIVNLEEKFNVHMDDEEIAKVKNLGELLNLLASTINK